MYFKYEVFETKRPVYFNDLITTGNALCNDFL